VPITPFCARFKRFGDYWFAFAGAPDGTPIDMLQLVVEAPEFLGMLAPEKPLPRAAMVAPQSQSNRVLVAVDEAGGVSLVVVPDPAVAGSLSAAVGELLAASGRLWHQKYEVLAAPFQEFLGMTLTEWVGMRVGEGWSVDKFKAGLESSLNEGKFPITVMVERLDPAAQETLSYLKNMNLSVRALGYVHTACNGDETVRPKLLAEARAPLQPQVQVPGRHPEPQPRPQTPPPQAPAPEPVRAFREEPLPSAPQAQAAPREREPLPRSDATPRQKEILSRLLGLDDIGLVRRGFEYYVPATGQQGTSDGTIVLAIDADRWPFPKAEEVIVVVNTDAQHLAGYLRVAPNEIVDFLSSLPREDRKEHKGCLLLKASNVSEASQLVNELKALKEVSGGGLG
jgi:hypothetical protein